MKRKSFFIMVLSVGLSASVMAMAGQAFVNEYQAAIVTRGSNVSILREVAQYEARKRSPFSTRAIREVVSTCATRVGRALSGSMDETEKAFRASCGRIIESILARNPTSSRALTAQLVIKENPTAQDLALAQASAPFEPWPLGTRLLLLEQRPDLLSHFASGFEQDLKRGFQSDWGVKMISGLYLRNEALRDVIAAAAETASPELKARFLANLKKGANNG